MSGGGGVEEVRQMDRVTDRDRAEITTAIAKINFLLPLVGIQLHVGVEGFVEDWVFQTQPVRPVEETHSMPIQLVALTYPRADIGHRDHRLGELGPGPAGW